MSGRQAFAYVVGIDGSKVTLNLLDAHKGHIAAHRDGVTAVTEVGGLFGVDGGIRLLVMRVRSLSFAEPREAHRAGIGSTAVTGEPLRHIEAVVAGAVTRTAKGPKFMADSLLSPVLGAEAVPLTRNELAAILNATSGEADKICLGTDVRGGGSLEVSLPDLLSRHVAVLGGTGQGKSCFTAAVLQQMLQRPGARVVVFDINGEYQQAFEGHVSDDESKISILGASDATFKIPYVALGRHGLGRLLLPSEKTQRPALNFALESLPYVKWFDSTKGVGLASHDYAVLFDDCRPEAADEAKEAITRLRTNPPAQAQEWPPMRALACLVADSHSLQPGRNGAVERAAFPYGNVAPLITRIHRYCEDPLFTSVVNVDRGKPVGNGGLAWQAESSDLVKKIFGWPQDRWKLHIVDLRNVAHDLLPVILSALLELLAFERFREGQGASHPTLLVLEEAHHYMRQLVSRDDDLQSMLAYERLAKEGRKFGLSMWVSTQRPVEVSPTVLAQCGTWAVFRLTSDQDLKAVSTAGEWVDRQELDRIAGLPRQQAVIFGSSVSIPIRVIAPTAEPTPKSRDPEFSAWSRALSIRANDSVPAKESANPVETQPPFLLDEDDDIPF